MSDNCQVALSELYEFLDGALDDETRQRIEQHLRECSPCLEAFDFETEVRRLIASRCRDECPDAVRARIQAAIEACGPGEVAEA